MKEGVALQRLRALSEQLAENKANWETHFVLAPNVRFTRTPDRDLVDPNTPPPAHETPVEMPQMEMKPMPQPVAHKPLPPKPAANQDAIGLRRALEQHLSSVMMLDGRMDVVEEIANLPAGNDNAAVPETAVPVQAETKSFTVQPLDHVSDFAFWEAADFSFDTGSDSAEHHYVPVAPIAQLTLSVTAPAAQPESVLSLYRPIEIRPASTDAVVKADARIEQPVAAAPAAELPVPVAKPQASGAFPWLQRRKLSESVAPVAITPAALTLTIPEEMTELPARRVTAREIAEPVVSEDTPAPAVSGVAITKPFKIEQASRLPVMRGEYEFPPRALLQDAPESLGVVMTQEQLERNAGLLESVLEDFGIRGEIIHVRPGPVVTLYEFEPAPGVKSSRVIGLADDIARSMSALSARVAVVPGRNVIGIELPNATRETVYFGELIDSPDFTRTSYKLPLCLGKTIGGEPVIAELAKMPHLLVAGTTGSGKSVAINTMILSLLYRLTPEECRLIMVDPKMLELSIYDGIPHLLTPVVTDPKKAVLALKWAVREMEERYRKMSRLGVRNIDGYNARAAQARDRGETVTHVVQTGFEKGTGQPIHESQDMDLSPMPYIVVIVDEMADLMMVAGKEIEGAIQRLAQMARAAGIHLIMATQRPSVDVITGTIKANFPTRISFQVTSKIDSRTILGEQGAEQLLGQGDMLHMAGGGRIMRVHGPFVSDEEVEKVVSHLKTQGRPEYLDTVTTDEEDADEEQQDAAVFDKTDMGAEDSEDLYQKAVKVVLRDKKCSTSYIQRRLGIGYNRAASLVERMEKEGLVGAANHVGKREIIRGNSDAQPVQAATDE